MKYRYIKRKIILELEDLRSGHLWQYDIDEIKSTVKIYKNGQYKLTTENLVMPIYESWLEEIRDGL